MRNNMKNNKFFNAMQEKMFKMTFRECMETVNGKTKALAAWRNGNEQGFDFPFLINSIRDDEVSDFLGTIEKAGFEKFVFYSCLGNDTESIVKFLKAGWTLAETFEHNIGSYKPYMIKCFLFEKEDDCQRSPTVKEAGEILKILPTCKTEAEIYSVLMTGTSSALNALLFILKGEIWDEKPFRIKRWERERLARSLTHIINIRRILGRSSYII